MKKLIIFLLPLAILACSEPPSEEIPYGNPHAEGFDLEGSDSLAIAIADQVMEAMGGRKAWDEARYFQWDFFGARRHLWNKKTGDIRIETKDTAVFITNIEGGPGQYSNRGTTLEPNDSLQERAINMWINDAYWLFMPFKLKDSGVTLRYIREDTTELGEPAHVLGLSFREVGVTPDNRYEVFVDKKSNLVTQWRFFRNFNDDAPGFTTLWGGYATYGGLLLGGDRGQRQISEIAVPDSIPDIAFTDHTWGLLYL